MNWYEENHFQTTVATHYAIYGHPMREDDCDCHRDLASAQAQSSKQAVSGPEQPIRS